MKKNKYVSVSHEQNLIELYKVGKELRLGDLSQILTECEKDADFINLPGERQVFYILMSVVERRLALRNERILKKTGVINPCIDIRHVQVGSNGLSRELLQNLRSYSWAQPQTGRWICITGASGVGKTGLVQSLIKEAASKGIASKYMLFSDLAHQIENHLREGTMQNFRNELRKSTILGIDDVGMGDYPINVLVEFKTIMDDRQIGNGLILSSQLPPPEWFPGLKRRELSDAICDRALAVSHVHIRLKGNSMRTTNPVTTE